MSWQERERETERQRDRQIETERDRERQRQRDRETERTPLSLLHTRTHTDTPPRDFCCCAGLQALRDGLHCVAADIESAMAREGEIPDEHVTVRRPKLPKLNRDQRRSVWGNKVCNSIGVPVPVPMPC